MYRAEIVAFLALGTALIGGCHTGDDTPIDPLQRYGWSEDSKNRQLSIDATETANQILADDVPLRFVPAWECRSTPQCSLPVYWLEPFGLAWTDRIFVPPGQKIVVINAQSMR